MAAPAIGQGGDKIEGSRQTYGLGDGRCARFETKGRAVETCAAEADLLDHLATGLPRGHLLEQLGATIQDTDAGGSIQFVAGEGVEVAA